MDALKIAIIGINGFGELHLHIAETLEREGLIKLKAVSNRNYDNCKEKVDSLRQRKVAYFEDYREMLEKEKDLDFVVVSTPIHLHKTMALDILKAGFNVLLEKPPAVTIQDLDELIETSHKTGKLCAVNFIYTASKAFNEIRKLIRIGSLGKISRICGMALWQRTEKYFKRSSWVGKLKTNGQYTLDGALNNPLSHLLNNMLIVASEKDRAKVLRVTAELYHANPIEGDDTFCLKAEMSNGIKIYNYGTLCSHERVDPYMLIKGSNGEAKWFYDNSLEVNINGMIKVHKLGREDTERKTRSIYENLIRVINGEGKLFCSLDDTRNFVLTSNGAYESSGTIHRIPDKYKEIIKANDSLAVHIKNIDRIIYGAMDNNRLFSDLGIDWAIPGKPFSLKNYKSFSLF